MQPVRDLCWLTKQKKPGAFSTFSIASDGPLAKTIQREFPELFKGVTQVNGEASVRFILVNDAILGNEGFIIAKTTDGFTVHGASEAALLYGMFALHRLVNTDADTFPYLSVPDQHLRMLNHWDNFDGSIERGYAGESIYYENNRFRGDLELVRQYARLLASVGINAVSINNVNVKKLEAAFITNTLPDIKEIAGVFAAYGIKTFLCINYAAPMRVGGLLTADPLDLAVIRWWERTVAGIYAAIPDFAGFLVKADSEGEPGPFTYGRNHAEGANMLARVVSPYGGLVIWRCFVYNCAQDWRDRTVDRARAAYDIFKPLDGSFDDNVALQIKNGPIDFQIREPNSPLFGALEKTNQILEFQVTQEYTGQQRHVCYLVPLWKETLDYDTKHGAGAYIKNVIGTQSPTPANSGVSAVVNVGMDANWTGHKLAQANLYGYGRLIWDNSLSSEEIAKEWTRLSFDLSEEDAAKVATIQTASRAAYEDYTCPLGIGFMCKPGHHYGVDVDGYEYDCWGTYHYADREGVGRERSVATGTGYTAQYSKERCAEYESLQTCPDEFLLFFHHVPYTHVLQSGKTVIQHIYDAHFEGFAKVEKFIALWKSLEGKVDEASFLNVRERLEEQLRSAREWRDQINTYFYRKSGIGDEKGRLIYP